MNNSTRGSLLGIIGEYDIHKDHMREEFEDIMEHEASQGIGDLQEKVNRMKSTSQTIETEIEIGLSHTKNMGEKMTSVQEKLQHSMVQLKHIKSLKCSKMYFWMILLIVVVCIALYALILS